MDRGAWWAKVHSVAKSWTWLSDLAQPSPSASKTGVLADEGKGQRVFLLLSYVWLFCDPMDGRLTRILCPWDFPGKNTGMGCLFLLQGFFPTQGSNSGLLDCRQALYHLSHQGSPLTIMTWKDNLRHIVNFFKCSQNCYSVICVHAHAQVCKM